MVVGTFSLPRAPRGVAVGVSGLALVASLCANSGVAAAQTAPLPAAPPSAPAPGPVPVVVHVDFGSGAPAQPPPPAYAQPPVAYAPPPPAYAQPPMVVAPAVPDGGRAEMYRQLQVADEYRTMRRGLMPLAQMGGSMAGLLVGSIPGGLILLSAGGSFGSSTSGAFIGGIFVTAVGALAGSLFGGTWAAWSAGNRLGGHGTYWATFGGTAIGYGGTLLVSLVAFGLSGAGTTTSGATAYSAVSTISYLLLPGIFATVLYEYSSEGVLGPMRAALGMSYAARGRARRLDPWLTPTAMPLMSADGRMSGVGVGLAGVNF